MDFTPHGTQPGLMNSLDGSTDCAGCHSGGGINRTFLPFNTWAGSMMSHATRDPLFWAALDVANNDVPGVGDYCLKCHTPDGWFGGRVVKNGIGGTVDGSDGCRLQGDHDDHDAFGSDFGGVGCHLCHRQRTQGPTGQTARLHNGNLWIGDEDKCPDGYTGPCRVGPYEYPDLEAGIGHPPHPVAYSESVKRSEFCGVCHDVTTPITDAGALKLLVLPNGTVSNVPFPVERTYSEWKHSRYADKIFVDGFAREEPSRDDLTRYGQTCQSCHMPNSMDAQARACAIEPEGTRTGNLRTHVLVGANVFVMGLIRDLYAVELSRVPEMTQSIARATALLTEQSADVGVTLQPIAANQLVATVRVTNLAGHKLPTGYAEGRRMWLDVEAKDANDNTIWHSGAYDDATGTLTQDAQIRIYETRQGIWNDTTDVCETKDGDGNDHFHFVLNDCIASDTRIPPLGFTGGNSVEMRPVPLNRYPETSPGSGVLVHYDDAQYTIPVPGGTATPITVTARLRHQIATKEYLEFLRDQALDNAFPSEDTMCADDRPGGLDTGPQDKSRGQFMYDLWTANGRSPPITMDSAAAQTP